MRWTFIFLFLFSCANDPIELPADSACTCQVELSAIRGQLENFSGYANWIDERVRALEESDAGSADGGE